TDKRVNLVTSAIWNKYKDLKELKEADILDLEAIIRPLGSFRRKALYAKEMARKLIDEYQGIVPKTHRELEEFKGVGRKVANVVLSNIFDIPSFAVDTHVTRVSKRLNIVKESDNVLTIEKTLMQYFPKDKWSRLHHQLVLFGRYKCKAAKPECVSCQLEKYCNYKKK
ncbi:MAG: endonuclease III, partial [Bacilli bacterium]